MSIAGASMFRFGARLSPYRKPVRTNTAEGAGATGRDVRRALERPCGSRDAALSPPNPCRDSNGRVYGCAGAPGKVEFFVGGTGQVAIGPTAFPYKEHRQTYF